MTDDPTKDLTDSEKLDCIIQEVTETRDALFGRLDRIEAQLKVMTLDMVEVRTDQRRLGDRMDTLERRPN